MMHRIRQTQRARRCEAGSVAIMCLFILAVSAVAIAAIAFETATRCRLMRINISHERALCIGEAGAEYGTSMIRSDYTYSGNQTPISFGDGSFICSVSVNGTRTILTSTGRASDGTAATVKVAMDVSAGVVPPDGEACMIANGNINVTSHVVTKTEPEGCHLASIRTNGNVVVAGKATVDGSAWSHGRVVLGGGASIYDPQYPTGHSFAQRIPFPSSAEQNSWKSRLISQALSGGSRPGILLQGTDSLVLNAPVYIDGDLTLKDYSTLTINGPGVVYVRGSIAFDGYSVVTNSGILAAGGRIRQAGSTRYRASGDLASVGLVSFSTNSNAIELMGHGASAAEGIICAAKGGIKVIGDTQFIGVLVACGENNKGRVKMVGHATITYPPYLLRNNGVLPRGYAVRAWLEP